LVQIWIVEGVKRENSKTRKADSNVAKLGVKDFDEGKKRQTKMQCGIVLDGQNDS